MASRKPKIADTTAIVTVRRAVSDDPPALDGGAVYPGGRAVSLSIARGAIVATVERAESRPLAVTFTPEELISAALDVFEIIAALADNQPSAWNLNSAAARNVDKLRARYPDGWSARAAAARADERGPA